MKYLSQMRLSNNTLTGTLPAEIGYGYPLEALDLSENQLRGTLPSSIRTLINLRDLSLQNNNLEGILPDMANLQQLGKQALRFFVWKSFAATIFVSHTILTQLQST